MVVEEEQQLCSGVEEEVAGEPQDRWMAEVGAEDEEREVEE